MSANPKVPACALRCCSRPLTQAAACDCSAGPTSGRRDRASISDSNSLKQGGGSSATPGFKARSTPARVSRSAPLPSSGSAGPGFSAQAWRSWIQRVPWARPSARPSMGAFLASHSGSSQASICAALPAQPALSSATRRARRPALRSMHPARLPSPASAGRGLSSRSPTACASPSTPFQTDSTIATAGSGKG